MSSGQYEDMTAQVNNCNAYIVKNHGVQHMICDVGA